MQNICTPINLVLDALEKAGCDYHKSGSSHWMSQCPSHADTNPSLSIREIDGNVSVKCFASCTTTEITTALGLTKRSLFSGNADDSDRITPIKRRRPARPEWPAVDPKWANFAKAAYYEAASQPLRMRALAERFGSTLDVLKDMRVSWLNAMQVMPFGSPHRREAYVFPERNGKGEVVGLVFRYADNSKKAAKGSRRGLTIPRSVLDGKHKSGSIFVVEGASCVAAVMAAGGAAVGRATNYSDIDCEYLAHLLSDHEGEIVIVGENDEKTDGKWPGKIGAQRTANKLAKLLSRSVQVAMPPEGFKDAREWLTSGGDHV